MTKTNDDETKKAARPLRNGGTSAVSPGRSNSSLSLGQRRRKAYSLFSRGDTVTDVARKLHVSISTASGYHQKYEDQLELQARQNPHLLRDVIKNTFRTLEELDSVRRQLWKRYYRAQSDGMRAQFLNLLLKAQDQRGRLLGLFGVKAEYMALVHSVSLLQTALLEFMQEELCPDDREKLEQFILEKLGGAVRDGEVISEMNTQSLEEFPLPAR